MIRKLLSGAGAISTALMASTTAFAQEAAEAAAPIWVMVDSMFLVRVRPP